MRRAVVRMRLGVGAMFATWAMLFASVSMAFGHPLHTTITDLVQRRDERVVRATIRIFSDDFGRAVLGLPASAVAPSASAVSDSAAAAYVRAHFSLSQADGRQLPLNWCGVRRSGDLVWLCVEARRDGSLRGLRVHNQLLFELYPDQVNIVQAAWDGGRASLLFTRGDGPRPVG